METNNALNFNTTITDFDALQRPAPKNFNVDASVSNILALAQSTRSSADFEAAAANEIISFDRNASSIDNFIKNNREFSLNQVSGGLREVGDIRQADRASLLSSIAVGSKSVLSKETKDEEERLRKLTKADDDEATLINVKGIAAKAGVVDLSGSVTDILKRTAERNLFTQTKEENLNDPDYWIKRARENSGETAGDGAVPITVPDNGSFTGLDGAVFSVELLEEEYQAGNVSEDVYQSKKGIINAQPQPVVANNRSAAEIQTEFIDTLLSGAVPQEDYDSFIVDINNARQSENIEPITQDEIDDLIYGKYG